MKRSKRLRKGLVSKDKEINLHLKKLETAIDSKDEYLMDYYKREIEAKTKDREKTLKILERKKKVNR